MSSLYTKEEATALVQETGKHLSILSLEQQADRDIVLAAVNQYGLALHYASEDLKNDRALVLVAVHNNGRAISDASAELQLDKEIVLAAVGQEGGALRYVQPQFKKDKDVVFLAARDTNNLFFASIELRSDRDFMFALCERDGFALEYAGADLQKDIKLVLTAVYTDIHTDTEDDYTILDICSDDMCDDRRVLFVNQHREDIPLADWPTIRQALLEKPVYFLNPESYMQTLVDGMQTPYLTLAQYALSKDVIIEPLNDPDLRF